MALIEAKAADLFPTHGLEQAKLYASCQRLNVQFVYASNGRLFVEYDLHTGMTTHPTASQRVPPRNSAIPLLLGRFVFEPLPVKILQASPDS